MTALAVALSAFVAWAWLQYRASQRRRISTSEWCARMRKKRLGSYMP